VVLVDGARHQLDLIQSEAARRKIQVHIVIDVVHVLERVWTAAWSLHPTATPAAEDWVATHALALLAGHTHQVITALDAQATAADLSADRRDGVDACIRYLTNNADHLHYDQALERDGRSPPASSTITKEQPVTWSPTDSISPERDGAWLEPRPCSSCAP
jgi:hypothetical protein